jgi:hypothetical protein
MLSALLGPLAYVVYKKPGNITNVYQVTKALLLGGLLTPLAVSMHSRIYEARFVESSPVINQLVPQ